MRRVYSSSGAPVFDYDPYGAPLQATAPITDFAYAGTVANADSGLYLTRHRAYDPVSGRFLSRDPIGEGGDPAGNLYAYVGGDPISLADPLGLCPPNLGAIAGFAALAAATEVLGGGPEDPVADALSP